MMSAISGGYIHIASGMVMLGTIGEVAVSSNDALRGWGGMALSGRAIFGGGIIGRTNRRLHSMDGPAAIYEDGTEGYFVHGIEFTQDEFDKFFVVKQFTARDILQLRNLEQKALIIKEIGYEKLMTMVNATLLDTYQDVSKITGKPVTYELREFIASYQPLLVARFVRVEDHSTHKITCLPVPARDETLTCLGAIAWTFGLTKEEYAPAVET